MVSHGVNVVYQEEAWSEIVSEMRLRWYGHMQRMKETNEMSAIGDMVVPGKDQDADQEGDGRIADSYQLYNPRKHQRSPRRSCYVSTWCMLYVI